MTKYRSTKHVLFNCDTVQFVFFFFVDKYISYLFNVNNVMIVIIVLQRIEIF